MSDNPIPGNPIRLKPWKRTDADPPLVAHGYGRLPATARDLTTATVAMSPPYFGVKTTDVAGPLAGGATLIAAPRPWDKVGYPMTAPPRAAIIYNADVPDTNPDVNGKTALQRLLAALDAGLRADLEARNIFCFYFHAPSWTTLPTPGFVLGGAIPCDAYQTFTNTWSYPGEYFNSASDFYSIEGGAAGSQDTTIPTAAPTKWLGREVIHIYLGVDAASNIFSPGFLGNTGMGRKVSPNPPFVPWITQVDLNISTWADALAAYKASWAATFTGGPFERSQAKLGVIAVPPAAPPNSGNGKRYSLAGAGQEVTALASARATYLGIYDQLAASMGITRSTIDVSATADGLPNSDEAAPTIIGWIKTFYGVP